MLFPLLSPNDHVGAAAPDRPPGPACPSHPSGMPLPTWLRGADSGTILCSGLLLIAPSSLPSGATPSSRKSSCRLLPTPVRCTRSAPWQPCFLRQSRGHPLSLTGRPSLQQRSELLGPRAEVCWGGCSIPSTPCLRAVDPNTRVCMDGGHGHGCTG